jgi:hypothetical protein
MRNQKLKLSPNWNFGSFVPLTPAKSNFVTFLVFEGNDWWMTTKSRQWGTDQMSNAGANSNLTDCTWKNLNDDVLEEQICLLPGPRTIAIVAGTAGTNSLSKLTSQIWTHLKKGDVVMIGSDANFSNDSFIYDVLNRGVRYLTLRRLFAKTERHQNLFICYAGPANAPIRLVSAKYQNQTKFAKQVSQLLPLNRKLLYRTAALCALFPILERQYILFVEKC